MGCIGDRVCSFFRLRGFGVVFWVLRTSSQGLRSLGVLVFRSWVNARVVLCSGYQEQRPGFWSGRWWCLFLGVFVVGLFYAPAAFLSASALSVFSQVNPGFVVTVSVRVFL